jgi:hypothetical protein
LISSWTTRIAFFRAVTSIAIPEILPVSGWPAVLDSADENCHQFVVAEAVSDGNKDAL